MGKSPQNNRAVQPGCLRRLPEAVINRIAAGEVVERPAAVIKELVENALDASARRIQLRVEAAGSGLISVQDDGGGIARADILGALERHVTSKLTDDRLLEIESFGFRGEALAAISAVSRLKLSSRLQGETHGWRVDNEEPDPQPQPCGMPEGTRVEVGSLFYSTPARLKFLRSPRSEWEQIDLTLRRLALAHPDVHFLLSDERRQRVSWLAMPQEHRWAEILDRDFMDNSLPISADEGDFRLSGRISLPTHHRKSRNALHFFVNKRPVSDRFLLAATRAAYDDLLPSGFLPAVVLFLQLPPEFVDVNVHPAKREVRFREPRRLRGFWVAALRHALASAGVQVAPSARHFARDRPAQPGAANGGSRRGISPLRAPTPVSASDRRRSFLASAPLEMEGREDAASSWVAGAEDDELKETASGALAFLHTQDTNDDYAADCAPVAGQAYLVRATDAPLGRPLAQIFETYILCQSAEGLIIVDQHAAHERLVYENLKAALAKGAVARQGLLMPEVVTLSQAACARLLAYRAELTDLGLELEAFGPQAILVRALPAVLPKLDGQALLRQLSDELEEESEEVGQGLRQRLHHALSRAACHGSVRAGRALTLAEMTALLVQMENESFTAQCNHGRPCHVLLTKADLERAFERRS